MPRLKIDREDPITEYMIRSKRQQNKKTEQIAAYLFCAPKTVNNRINNPGNMTIREFRKLIELFRWSEGDIIKMIKGFSF